jgi:predicted SAM-dependent methyltransferase
MRAIDNPTSRLTDLAWRAARALGRLVAPRSDRSARLAAALFPGLETPIGLEPLLRRERASALSHPALHLGCGDVHLPGWCNIDLRPTPATDVLDDVRTLRRFQNASADRIYACHVLEYLSHGELVPALRRWHSLLRHGGELRLAVLDLSRLFSAAGPAGSLEVRLYGVQRHPYDFRKTGFTRESIHALLEAVGFEDVVSTQNEPHFIPGVRDLSILTDTSGQYTSATVAARKR